MGLNIKKGIILVTMQNIRNNNYSDDFLLRVCKQHLHTNAYSDFCIHLPLLVLL